MKVARFQGTREELLLLAKAFVKGECLVGEGLDLLAHGGVTL